MTLVPFTRRMLHALIRGREAFAIESGLQMALDWPHHDFANALDWLVGLRENQPTLDDWSFLVVDNGRVVGDIGTKGTPVQGVVEVGYGIAAGERRRGFASRALAQLLAHCASHGVHTVTAECLDVNHGSIRVLERAGFVQIRTRDEGTDRLLCYVKRLSPPASTD
jgi:RimJ/RimL family protein N-acetyltransferase